MVVIDLNGNFYYPMELYDPERVLGNQYYLKVDLFLHDMSKGIAWLSEQLVSDGDIWQ